MPRTSPLLAYIYTMKKFILTLVAAAATLSAFAWGQKGHDTVANIAERHFTAATADSVAAILDGMSPVYWANWLDNASHTPEYYYTKTWHYKNIDAGQDYDSVPRAEKGDVVSALREQIAILADSVSTKSQKALALKIVIHLVGDLHQPMHMGHKSDLGGNKVQVRFFDRGTNLHSVWDTNLPNTAHSWTYTEWTDQLDRATPARQAELTAGNIDDWARESVAIAARVYDYFPSGTKISYNQIAQWTPTIEQQLLRGGLRLAEVLNAVFDPAFSRTPAEF